MENPSEAADKHGCQWIATGHYVQLQQFNGKLLITPGIDEDKDQSFFLWGLQQDLLSRIIFPLGNYNKDQVREVAKQKGYQKVSTRKDSLGICFIEGNDYRPFLAKELEARNITIPNGKFIDKDKNLIGQHQGFHHYTIGQRKGLGINLNKRLFVTDIDAYKNEVTVGEFPELMKREIVVKDYVLHDQGFVENTEPVIVKIRYRNQATPATVEIIDEKYLKLHLLEDLSAIAPGQTAVLYYNDMVIGGGFIE